jgi:hypothetical protein
MKIMERKYVCANGVVERTRYVVGDNARPRSSRKKGNTSFRKQEANFNGALRRLARILNCNYTHENGLLITLDYDPAGMESLCRKAKLTEEQTLWAMGARVGEIGEWKAAKKGKQAVGIDPYEDAELEDGCAKLREAAEKQMNLWLRRIKRKAGNLKYIAVTSDIDGDTGEAVRIHHHLVIAAEGLSWDLLQQQWRLGSVDIRRLRGQKDYTPVAVYLLRQVRRQPDAKKYAVSRGMLLPAVTEREVLGNPEIRVPAGASVLERAEYNAETVVQYVRYVPKKRESRTEDGGGERGI